MQTQIVKQIVTLAELPGGWVIPLVALFLFFLGLWALAGRFSERIEVSVHPETLAEQEREARLRLASRERSADVQQISNYRRTH